MDIAKSFTFMFEDPEWLPKLAIGTGLVLVGMIFMLGLVGFIPLLIVLGYSLAVTRNVLDGQGDLLPGWHDWGSLLVAGVKLAVVYFVWALPMIILFLPLGLGSALLNQQNQGGLQAIGGSMVACTSCLAIIWGLLLTLFSPAFYVRLARTNRIASCFDVAAVWAYTRSHLANVIVAILLVWAAQLVASLFSMVGLLVLLIGVIITVPFAILWSALVQAHLFGQTDTTLAVPAEPAQA